MNPPATARRETAATIDDLACCLSCRTPLQGGPHCPDCGRAYPFVTAFWRRSVRSEVETGSRRRSTTARAGSSSDRGNKAS